MPGLKLNLHSIGGDLRCREYLPGRFEADRVDLVRQRRNVNQHQPLRVGFARNSATGVV